MTLRWAALLIAMPALAHRLDEYLQAATLSLEPTRITAQLRLAPGVAVWPKVLAAIDTNHDGQISKAEEQAYAQRVLTDLSLTLDAEPLKLQLTASQLANSPKPT